MALPSKAKQVEKIAELLNAALDAEEKGEGMSTEDLAETIVNGYISLFKGELKAPLVPHVGMAFNHPALSGVWHVAHEGSDGALWIISANTRFGGVVNRHSDFWDAAGESKDNRKPKKDSEGALLPLSPRPGSPGQNPDWKAGDKVSRRQRQSVHEVVATGDKCVLLLNVNSGRWTLESNDNMAAYYRREQKIGEIEW